MSTTQESSPLSFVSRQLDTTERRRWSNLISLVVTPDWWQRLFAVDAVAAGGAALYVCDPCQCIDDVGDVDVWVRQDRPETAALIAECVAWLRANNVEFEYRLTRSMVSVWNARVPIQFIAAGERSVTEILRGFDFEPVQCAIFNGDRCVMSTAAQAAFVTRTVRWSNDKVWQFRRLPEVERERAIQMRVELRQMKLRRKKFDDNASAHRPHRCAASHRRACSVPDWPDGRRTALTEADTQAIGNMYALQSGIEYDEHGNGTARIVGGTGAPMNVDGPDTGSREHRPNRWIRLPRSLRLREYLNRQEENLGSCTTDSNRRQWCGIRNARMWNNVDCSLEHLRNSILSDARKCGWSALDLFASMQMSPTPFTHTYAGVLIERFFGVKV